MTRIARATVAVVLLLGAIVALPGRADAHALLQSADPAAGSTLASSPPAITLTFGEAPDPGLSSVKVLDKSGRSVAAGAAQAVPGQPTKLRVALPDLPEGVYTVAWITVSAVDGHKAAGSFAFGVGVAPSAANGGSQAPTSTSPSASVASTLARWLLYVGLVGLFGAGFVGGSVLRRPPRGIVALAAVGWLLSAIGAAAVVGLQLSDSEADLGRFIGSALGAGIVSRALVVVGSAVVVGVLLAWPGRIERWLYALAAACAAAGMLVDVAAGHAAAGSQAPLQVGIQWLHILSAGVWMGGLTAMLIGLRGSTSDEKAQAARRFSRWAGVALGVIAVTGVLRAISEVGTLDALVNTDFGRLVILKSALLGVLALLGAANRYISVPAAARTLAPLRRVGSTEVAMGAAVLLATGLLVNLAPPSSVAAAPSAPPVSPVVASGSDFGTSVRLRLVVTPGTAGFNQFTAAVVDYDTGAPIPASTLALRFTAASGSGIGPSTLALQSNARGQFAASGGNLSLDGIWKITATVTGQSGAVEVPLAVATRVAGQQVDENAIAGAPTISTAHLSAGRSVQVYLDPGRTGANELHATFFDAAGNELPVTSSTMLVSVGGVGSVLAPRTLEPGHFVAEVEAQPGPLGVDVVGIAPRGDTLHAHLEIQVQS